MRDRNISRNDIKTPVDTPDHPSSVRAIHGPLDSFLFPGESIMKRSTAIWFVVGFMCGVGSLLIGLLAAPGILSPAEASGEIPQSGAAIDQAQWDEVVRVAKHMNRLLEEVERVRSERSDGAKQAGLRSDVMTLRSQLELYKIQHYDKVPGVDARGNFNGKRFVKALTSATNSAGESGIGGEYYCGPYLRRFPSNPFVKGPAASRIKGGPGPSPYDGTSGWYLDTRDGGLYPNNKGGEGM